MSLRREEREEGGAVIELEYGCVEEEEEEERDQRTKVSDDLLKAKLIMFVCRKG